MKKDKNQKGDSPVFRNHFRYLWSMDVRLIIDSNSVKRKGEMRTIVHEQVFSNTVDNIIWYLCC